MQRITLEDDIAQVTLAPSLGASILAYNVTLGTGVWPIFRANLTPENVLDTACFPLVPYSNRIREGQFHWGDRQVKLALNNLPEKHSNHGHGWQVKWDIIEQSSSRVVLQYSHKADQWPFSYTARQTINLHHGDLIITLSLTNTGTEAMPAGLGMHPYFTRTALSSLQSDLKQMWAVDQETMPTHITAAPPSLAQCQGMAISDHVLDNAFIGFKQSALLHWPEWGVKAEMTTSENCQFLVVYTPKNKDFFCVEPVTHSSDAVNMCQQPDRHTGIKTLPAGQTYNMQMKIAPRQEN